MKRVLILIVCLCPMILYGQSTLSTLDNIHSVSKGETWESVAAGHGIPVSELQAANPDIGGRKLKKGMLLIIPTPVASPQRQAVDSSLPEETEENQNPPVRTSISNLKVGVLLPFSDARMLEFYRGFLMAADSVRRSGVNLDIYAWDCGSTIAQTEKLLPELTDLDVIFGPASSTQIPSVAEMCRERGIRLILPFWNGQSVSNYPLVYNATAPTSSFYDAAIQKVLSYYADRNYIIVHSDTSDNKGKVLRETLSQSLEQRKATAKFLDLEGDDFAYESAFNQFRNNMILLDDSSVRSLNILMSHLKDFSQKHPQYRFSLLGYPEWQDETQHLLADFFAFDTYIISPYYYNVLEVRTKQFQRSYEKFFRTPIAQNTPRYAALGFDLGYYIMTGISSLGDTFEQMQGSLRQEPYQNWFKFEREASGMSFSNRFVQLIHYTPEERIEVVR